MFGTPFGAPAPSTSPFGAPAPATGFGAFGSSAPTPAFGQPATPFGAPAPAAGGFGAPAAGAFGSAPTTSLFGSSTPATPFGAPAPVTAFGAPAPATGFGATPSLFGAQTPAAAGAFGASTPFGSGGSSGLAFGAPKPTVFGAPAPAFGASTATASNPFAAKTTSPFGAPATSPFGAPASTTSPFGASAPAFGAPATPAFGAPVAPGGFGATAAPNPFGAPATSAFGGGGFGVAGGQKGTGTPPYRDTQERENASGAAGPCQTFTYKSITKMPEYQTKSFEELRCEDYAKGNKGQSTSTASPFGLSSSPFGAQTPAPSPFGAAPAANPFAPKPATSPFGAPAPIASPFGAPAAPASSPFGAAPTGGLFGAAPATPAASPFGAAPATNPFAPKPATSPFGAPSPSPFGAAPTASPFGAAPAANPFAPKPAISPFGAPAPSTNLFGAPLGGTPAVSPFGAPPATSLFGAPAAGPSITNIFGPTAVGAPPAASTAGVTMVQAQTQYVQLPPVPSTNPYPYGRHSLFAPAAAPAPVAAAPGAAIASANAAPLMIAAPTSAPPPPPSLPAVAASSPLVHGVIPRSVTSVRAPGPASRAHRHGLPRQGELSLAPPPSAVPVTRCAIVSSSGSESGGAAARVSDSAAPFNPLVPFRPARVLNLDSTELPTPEGLSGTPLGATSHVPGDETVVSEVQSEPHATPATRPALTRVVGVPPSGAGVVSGATRPQPRRATDASEIPAPLLEEISRGRMPQSADDGENPDTLPEDAAESESPPIAPDGATAASDEADKGEGREGSNALLSRPTRAELLRMSDEELSAVEDFEVSRPGLGAIVWPGLTDLRGLPTKLDSLVKFGSREVVLYPNVPEELKPRPGEALNKRFIYTMEGVWARDKRTSHYLLDARSVATFRNQLQLKADRLGVRMLSYNHERGLWRVEVVPS